ncbi:MAG: sigma-54 interaction domain-containing protein [Gemmatimonadota bacterium]
MPRIALLQLSESFESLWPQLAAGSDLLADFTSGADAYVIAAAGIEEEAPAHIAVALAQGAPLVVVAGAAADHRIAVQLILAGASDYFALPGDLERLRAWFEEVARRAAARADAQALAARERASYDFSRLIGASAELRAALDRAARIISHADATVLITGETGTGKELLAQAIHYNGPRASEPIIEINSTALPASLLEGELFGYEKGAFTGATSSKPGLFEAAHGGTLFLDEIGDLSLELQAKLLRALETRQARRLGSVRTVDFDVRVIAATHIDLAGAVRDGRFREDLYYRLNVVPIHLPPLRMRGQDVLLLAQSFIDQFAQQYGIARPALGDDVRATLLAHDWPGNVRELRNALERALLLGDGGLAATDLLPVRAAPARATAGIPFPARMDAIEREAALAMVRHCAGNKTAAAEALGISRSRLYRLIGEADA